MGCQVSFFKLLGWTASYAVSIYSSIYSIFQLLPLALVAVDFSDRHVIIMATVEQLVYGHPPTGGGDVWSAVRTRIQSLRMWNDSLSSWLVIGGMISSTGWEA